MGRVSAVADPENEPGADRRTRTRGVDRRRAASRQSRRPARPDLGYRRFDCTGDDPESLAAADDAARAAVEAGECIVLPTDTVYGIGADAFNAEAVQRLLDAKVRGRDMPPPVLIGEPSLIRALAVDVPEQAKELVERALARSADDHLQAPAEPADGSGRHRGHGRAAGARPRAGPGDPAGDRSDGGQQRQPQRPARRAHL